MALCISSPPRNARHSPMHCRRALDRLDSRDSRLQTAEYAIGNSHAMKEFHGPEVAPRQTGAHELSQFFSNGFRTFWHQSCTAKVGRHAMSVADGDLKIYDIVALRIADASILPCTTCRRHHGTLRAGRRYRGESNLRGSVG
jgi:choline dehydrogenase-like flavoprotein